MELDALAGFWNSPLGLRIREQPGQVHRELAFTAGFTPKELAALAGLPVESKPENELVVVQGVADLVVLRPEEIWLIDFKTDQVEPKDLAERAELYQPQLRLYSRALERIYRRSVSGAWLYFTKARAAVGLRAEQS